MVKIVKSDLSGTDRYQRYPNVFATKGIVSNYINKGRASKTRQDGEYHYQVAFNMYQFHGDGGQNADPVTFFESKFERSGRNIRKHLELCLSSTLALCTGILPPSTRRGL